MDCKIDIKREYFVITFSCIECECENKTAFDIDDLDFFKNNGEMVKCEECGKLIFVKYG